MDQKLIDRLECSDIVKNLTEIEGPKEDEFTGKIYYTGIIVDPKTNSKMKIKFDVKFVEYGKTKVIE